MPGTLVSGLACSTCVSPWVTTQHPELTKLMCKNTLPYPYSKGGTPSEPSTLLRSCPRSPGGCRARGGLERAGTAVSAEDLPLRVQGCVGTPGSAQATQVQQAVARASPGAVQGAARSQAD